MEGSRANFFQKYAQIKNADFVNKNFETAANGNFEKLTVLILLIKILNPPRTEIWKINNAAFVDKNFESAANRNLEIVVRGSFKIWRCLFCYMSQHVAHRAPVQNVIKGTA